MLPAEAEQMKPLLSGQCREQRTNLEAIFDTFDFRCSLIQQKITEHVGGAEKNERIGPKTRILRFPRQLADRFHKRFGSWPIPYVCP